MTYKALTEILKTRKRKLADNTYVVRCTNFISIVYYNIHILRFRPSGTIQLDRGGWHTKSTKSKINKYLPMGYRITQDNKIWYINSPTGDQREFKDGITIKPIVEG